MIAKMDCNIKNIRPCEPNCKQKTIIKARDNKAEKIAEAFDLS